MSEAPDTFAFQREYEAPAIAHRMSNTPRFNRPSDITALFSGDSGQERDYVVGLILSAVLIIVAFVVWSLLLLIWKCLGGKSVGFLSGFPFQQPSPKEKKGEKQRLKAPEKAPEQAPERAPEQAPPRGRPSDHNQETSQHSMYSDANPSVSGKPESWYDEDVREVPPAPASARSRRTKRKKKAWLRRPTRIRIAFILSGCIFITFVFLLFAKGVSNLQSTVNTIEGSAEDLNTLAVEAQDIINSGIKDIRDTATAVRDLVVRELQGANFCPADPSLESSEEGRQVKELANTAVDLLGQLNDFVANEVDELEAAAESGQELANQVSETAGKIDLTDWEALLIMLPYTLVPCLLMAGAVMAFFDVSFPKYTCVVNWFLLPLFIIMVIVAWGVSAGMVMAAGLNGDFCLPGGRQDGSPDETILEILELQGFTNNTYPGQVAEFYVNQCTTGEDPFQFLRDYLPELAKNELALNQLSEALIDDNTVAELSLYCDRDFAPLESLIEDMKEILAVVVEAMSRALDLVRCDRIVPIYTNTVYDATCTYSVSALYWIFSCALIMGFFGMLMITFRAAYKKTIYYPREIYYPHGEDRDEEDEDDDGYQSDDPNSRHEDFQQESEPLSPRASRADETEPMIQSPGNDDDRQEVQPSSPQRSPRRSEPSAVQDELERKDLALQESIDKDPFAPPVPEIHAFSPTKNRSTYMAPSSSRTSTTNSDGPPSVVQLD